MRAGSVKVALALIAGGVLFGSDVPGAYAATPEREVLVVNPATNPVFVQGQATVSGTVACTQTAPYHVFGSVDIGSPTVNAVISGTPAVTLAGTPEVTLAGAPMVTIPPKLTTTPILRDLTLPPGGFVSLNVPTSEYEEIRVLFDSNCGGCDVQLRYFIGTTLIDQEIVEGARNVTKLFRLPGTSFFVEVTNVGGMEAEAKVVVFGRP